MTKTLKYHPGQPRQISLFQAHKYHDTLKLRLLRNSWEQPVFLVAGQNKQFVRVRLKTRFVIRDFGQRAKSWGWIWSWVWSCDQIGGRALLQVGRLIDTLSLDRVKISPWFEQILRQTESKYEDQCESKHHPQFSFTIVKSRLIKSRLRLGFTEMQGSQENEESSS